MAVEIEIELEGVTNTLVYYRSRRAISINNVVFIWPRKKSGNPEGKEDAKTAVSTDRM